MSDFKDSARARRGETVGEWQAIDVCHWVCQCFLQMGALAKPVARNPAMCA